jgi:hypothetical protein
MNNLDYRELLNHFEGQRTRRQAEFKKEMEGIEETISGLRKMLANQPQAPLFDVNPRAIASAVGKYAGLSVRWAILNLLAEDREAPMPTAAIAETLRAGGITSNSQNFTSNVSAVISDMTNKKQELEPTDSGYRLTETGRKAWDAIKHTHQYVNRFASIAS